MTMPVSDLHDPEFRGGKGGTKVRYLYCPDCGYFSGGGVCRVCERGVTEFVPPLRRLAPQTANDPEAELTKSAAPPEGADDGQP